MKLPVATLLLGAVLAMTVTAAVKSMSLPASCPQDTKKARVSGVVVSRSALGGKKYSISIKLKNCKCEECKGKCSDCCIPQETIDSDENGNFKFSLGPGTYNVQVSGRDSSRIEIEVSAGESKNISLTAD